MQHHPSSAGEVDALVLSWRLQRSRRPRQIPRQHSHGWIAVVGEITGFFAVQGPYDEGPDLLELGLTAAEEDRVARFWDQLATIREGFRQDGIAADR